MDWNGVAAVAELVGATAVVVSLVYLAIQVREGTRQSRLAVQRSVVNELGRVQNTIAATADFADVWVRGIADYDALSLTERARVSSLLAHMFKLFEQLYVLQQDGSLPRDDWHGFERAIGDIVAYPGVQRWWQTRSHWMTPAFQAFLEARISAAGPPGIYKEQPAADRASRPG